ncbi:MAG: hypothetical protein ABSH47_10935 [Bryobacteraceae bacterium]
MSLAVTEGTLSRQIELDVLTRPCLSPWSCSSIPPVSKWIWPVARRYIAMNQASRLAEDLQLRCRQVYGSVRRLRTLAGK